MQSTYVTWNKVCAFHNIPKDDWKLNGQYNYIEFKNGSRIDLLDLKFLPSDPLYERFGSLEYTDGAIEEAGEVNFLAYDVLQSRIGRHLNDQLKPTIAITGNPKKNWTYKEFYKKDKEGTLPEDTVFIQSLYSDNPHTAESYKKQLSNIKDKSIKQRLMFGNWEYDDDPATMIDFDAITDLFTNTIEKSDKKYMSVDVARFGRDKTVISLWNGLECYKLIEYIKQGTDVTAQKIKDLAKKEQIPYSNIIIDEDGIGGGIVDNLKGVKGFVNNSTPIEVNDEKPNFQHLKAQCYYKLAELINEHKMAVKTDNEQTKALLMEELEQVKTKDADKDGKKKVLGKDDIKAVLGRSPDYADNLMMRVYFEISPIYGIIRPKYNIKIKNYG